MRIRDAEFFNGTSHRLCNSNDMTFLLLSGFLFEYILAVSIDNIMYTNTSC